MKYTLVVFSSRSETMQFFKNIKNFGLFCSIINTPRTLSKSCGVSVKIDKRLVNASLMLIQKLQFSTFKGIFEVDIINKKEIANRIY